MNSFKKIKKQIYDFFVKFLKNTKIFLKHNVLFVTYVIVCFINACLLRFFTVKNFTALSPVLADFSVILGIGALGYLLKRKNRFKYYMFWTIVFTAICVINSAYYTNYASFTSFSLLATSMQIFGVSDALRRYISFWRGRAFPPAEHHVRRQNPLQVK